MSLVIEFVAHTSGDTLWGFSGWEVNMFACGLHRYVYGYMEASGRRQMRWHSPPYSLETQNLKLSNPLHLLSSELPGSVCLGRRHSWAYRLAVRCPAFNVGPVGQNSGLHTCTALSVGQSAPPQPSMNAFLCAEGETHPSFWATAPGEHV